MRLAIDATVVRAPESGVHVAVRQQVLALLRHRDSAGAGVFCAEPSLAEAVAAARGQVLPAPGLCRVPACRLLWQQVRLPARLRHSGAPALFAPAYTAPRHCPVPYALQVHDVIALEYPQFCAWQNVLHMRHLLPASARAAAAVLVPTRTVADRLAATVGVPTSRIHVLPLGVDSARFAAPAPRPIIPDMVDERPYLLFVGNLEPKKDVLTLLRGYSKAADRLGQDLVLAGRPAWKSGPVLAALRHWRGPGRVHLMGRVADQNLLSLYRHARSFVFPSLVEGFGLPILEAMAAGLPVIHSDCPALVETAGGAGFPFRCGDADALARALVQVQDSPRLRSELVERGRAHAQASSWTRWAEVAAPILQRLAAG